MQRTVPESTLRRFPAYLLYLQSLHSLSVSCTDLARDLRLDASQIRKDFEFAGIPGKPKVGYSVPELLRRVEGVVGWKQPNRAVMVGSGSVARAILNCEQIRPSGLQIAAVFDADERRIGTTAEGFEVMPLGFLPDMARHVNARTGILAVPPDAAQNIADLMVAAGITALWNFAAVALRTPPDVIVQNSDLCSSLAMLSARIAQRDAAVDSTDSPESRGTGAQDSAERRTR